jgi:hypothetical protein
MKINICTSVLKIKSDAQVSCSGDDINTLEWHDNNPTNITNTQILAKQIELQTAEDNRIEQDKINKQSAINKLKALGLNDAEIKSIIG